MEHNDKNIVKTLVAYGRQIDALGKRLEKVETQARHFEANVELILKELIRSGCLNIGDRRRPLKRTTSTLDALIHLLHKKGLINKKILAGEMKKLRQDKPPEDG